MSNQLKVSTEAAPNYIKKCLNANLVPMLHGSPGTAKSSMVYQVAEELELEMIDLRLSQCDPTDLAGFPTINEDRTKAGYVPMDTFPVEGDDLPKNKKGWMLFLDEFPSATMAVQVAAYKLVLDRQVGQFNLHDKVHVVAAGNLSTDRAIVNRLSTAMQSRLVHLEVKLNPKSWTDWASGAKLDHRVISFINFKPDLLHSFNPDHDDYTFPCARTWEFVSKLLENEAVVNRDLAPLITGTVGPGAGMEFITYCSIYKELPSVNDILKDPKNIEVSKEPSVLYALTGMIANQAEVKTWDTLMEYVNRLPKEFQVITMQNSVARCPEIEACQSWDDWLDNSADNIM